MTDVATTPDHFARAQSLIPGGVNSPVRAFGSVGGTPRFIASAPASTWLTAVRARSSSVSSFATVSPSS